MINTGKVREFFERKKVGGLLQVEIVLSPKVMK